MSRPSSASGARPTLRARLAAIVVAALAAGILTVALPTSAAVADDSEAISAEPCDGAGEKDDRSRFTYEASPGQQISDCFRVENTGTTTQHVTVYGTDAFNTEDGSYGLLDADAAPVDAGSWVVFDDGSARPVFDLGAGESRAVRFTLTVPANAGPGDHAAGILASAQTPSEQILVDRRVGTRLYVRVPGELQSLLNITGMSAVYNADLNPLGGSTTVNLIITNQGNVALAPTLVLGVRTFFGSDLVDRRLENIDELLPGASRTLSYDLGPVGQFVYVTPYASLFARDDLSGAATPAPPAPQVDREVGVWAVPWILVGLLLVAGLVFLFLRGRRRRDEVRAAQWVAFTEEEARRKAAAERTESDAVPVGR
ncbi:MAG: hypothetical protein K0Q58_118 [Microbacterium sp.]|nr:hypothetical protein [Microbacterium sp.]